MGEFLSGVVMTMASAPGTGTTIPLSGAATIGGVTFMTLAQAGAIAGHIYDYSLLDKTNGGFEQGFITMPASGLVMTSRTVTYSTNGNSPINASIDSLFYSSGRPASFNDASVIRTGTIDTARLGSGTANSSTFLRGDQSWAAIVSTGRLIGFNFYTSSQTITIPAGATQCFVEMSGAASGIGGNGSSGGGALRKYLSSITAGLTLALTIGASGGTNGNGGNSTLASGTQTITTLTASGGSTAGNGGNGSNGDANFSGLSPGAGGTAMGVTALGLGWGYNGSGVSNTTAGICQIWWFS